jgi:hypothetical protein
MRELNAEDFKKAIPNPFYDKLVKEVVVPVDREDYVIFEEVARNNDETPESVMKRCLHTSAKRLQATP